MPCLQGQTESLPKVGDILPTGYSVAKHAWKFLPDEAKQFDTSVAVLGCGPVGICGVLAAKQKFTTVYAIDSVPERLELAKKAGAIPVDLTKNPVDVIKAATDGRGPDAVL
jgi:threonine dehydrogenase-like Zn-dependent dehydrogenase